jgi:predicted GH43/DUF377 family glycosyl hydrolase
MGDVSVKKKKASPIMFFFILFAGFLVSLFIFQIFFANQNFSNKPIYGDVGSTQTLTQEQIQNEINSFLFQILFFNQLPTEYYSKLTFPILSVSSSYFGTVTNGSYYNFAPTVIKDGNLYKMWWCGGLSSSTEPQSAFGIYHAASTDSFNWSEKQLVLQPTPRSGDSLFVCQPSVVKVNDIYYMYYVGGSEVTDQTGGLYLRGAIFLATSRDGIRWTKFNHDDIPTPIFNLTQNGGGAVTYYSQPSVLYYNNKFYLYYTNSSSGKGTDVFLATSDDGIYFNVQNNVQPVFAPPVGDDRDVKYLNSSGTFFMVYGSIDTNKIFWTNSSDGIHWIDHADSRTISTKKQCNFGPALIDYGNKTGDLKTAVYYAAGDTLKTQQNSCVNPTSWYIDASLINITVSNPEQNFTVSDFKCSAIVGGYNCRINYSSTLNESAMVLFLFVNQTGDVISTSVPVANPGILQSGMIALCDQLYGDFKISYRVYRQSDINMTTPIEWSKSSERQTVSCIV